MLNRRFGLAHAAVFFYWQDRQASACIISGKHPFASLIHFNITGMIAFRRFFINVCQRSVLLIKRKGRNFPTLAIIGGILVHSVHKLLIWRDGYERWVGSLYMTCFI